jgi:predicted transcriptional regulator
MTATAIVDSIVELAADVVSAYVSNNPVPAAELPSLIEQTHAAMRALTAVEAQAAPQPPEPAVPVKKSVTPDYIVCLEDGKKFKSLRRHLTSRYGITPDEYRAKWNLPPDYPMVAPNYAATRSALAKKSGLGRKPVKSASKPSRGRGKAAA